LSQEAPKGGSREALLAGGATLVTVVLWASAFVGIRAAGEDLSPGPLSLARLLVGSAALGALVLVRRERFPARRDLFAIAVCGGGAIARTKEASVSSFISLRPPQMLLASRNRCVRSKRV
jgi:drug/metabolite transporter (DMT)-like permease